jgi:hypothetical protein
MRKIALGVLVFISLAMLPTSAANAPKAGASCQKAGATQTFKSVKFTCIKSGKKLIWNKGVKVSVPRPSATPTPAASPTPTVTPTPVASPSPTVTPIPTPTPEAKPFIPWSTDATAQQVSDAAQKSFRDWATEQLSKKSNHEFKIHPSVPPNVARSLTLTDALGAQLFSQFFTTRSATVIGTDEKWVVDQLNAISGDFKSCNMAASPTIVTCFNGISTQGVVVKADSPFNPRNLMQDGSALLAHEYFHLVQYQLANSVRKHTIQDGSALTAHLFPAWFAEGSAEFVSYSVASMAMGSEYWQGRDAMNNFNSNPTINRNPLIDSEIRIYNGTQPAGPTNPYMIGRTAIEYLVASIGFQGMLDIWSSFKETNSFEKSFPKVTGKPKTEFYEKFEKIRTNLGMPPTTWKLVCLTDTPLKDVPAVLPKCDIKSTLPGGLSG